MAVPEQTPYIEHTGNGVTTSFSLGFQCESKDHLIVLVDEIEPPIATWSLTGGNVVFTTAPAAGKKITLQRNTPFNRTAEYQSFNNSFRPQTVNIDFDRIWWKLQELGVADWLMKLYVDQQHQQQEQKINDLKGYVDDRDDELRAYLMEEIRKQGVALDQLDDYYNYLMQRLAQIAVDKGWDASFVVDGDKTQKQVNDDTLRRFLDLSDTTIHMQRYHLLIADGYWDEAIKQGVRDAVQSTFGGIFKLKFPAGVIKVRDSSVFTLGLTAGIKRGLVIEGEGKQSTIFYMITRRADNSGNDHKWFYDNGQSNPKFDYVQTMNCSFTSDNKLFGHGFKVWSAGTEKAFLYNNCAFGSSANAAANLDTVNGGLGKGFYFWGTGNADQTDWIACNITMDDDLITLDNNQSVGFNFFGGTCSVYGDVIKVTGNGGGDVNWHGTTMHMLQKVDETDMKYMVNVDADLSFGNDRFNFNSIRMELRGNYKGLVNAPRQTGTLNVNFDGAGLVSVGVTNIVTGVVVGASKKVTFNNTNIPERYYYELTSSSTSLNNGGVLGFESCCLGVGGSSDIPLYKRIVGVGNGCAYANNCYYNGSGGAVNFKVSDFYLGDNANARMPTRKLKAVNLKRSATAFPNAAGASGELSTEFPVGTLIKSITVIKPSNSSGVSNTYQLHVGNSDKSKTYGSSEELPFSSEHRVVVDVNLLIVDEADAIVRVWATGLATNNVSGGVALVEYY